MGGSKKMDKDLKQPLPRQTFPPGMGIYQPSTLSEEKLTHS